MTNSQRLATVRAHLQRWLNENYAPCQQQDVAEFPILEQSVVDPAVELGLSDASLVLPIQEGSGPEPFQGSEGSSPEDKDDVLKSAECESETSESERPEFSVVGVDEAPPEATSVTAAPERAVEQELLNQAGEQSGELVEESSLPESLPISVPIEEPVGPSIVNESILIRDGFYAGRTFHAVAGDSRFKATWFMEPDELKIRDGVGEVLAVFQGEEITEHEASAIDSPSHGEVAEDQKSGQQTVRMPMPAAEGNRDIDGEDQIPKAA